MPTIADELNRLKALLETDNRPEYVENLDHVTGTTSTEIYYGYKRVLHYIGEDPGLGPAIKSLAAAIRDEIDKMI